jgi:hypothetical protein
MRERPSGLATLLHLAKRTGQLAAFPFRLAEDSDELLLHSARVKTLVSGLISTNTFSLEIVHIGDTLDVPWNVSRRFDIQYRIEDGRLCGFDRSIPHADTSLESKILILCAAAGLLYTWERIEEDLDLCFHRGYRQVIILLGTDKLFRSLDFAGHSYLLSVLLNSFPRMKFSTKLEVYVAPPVLHQGGRLLSRLIRSLGEEARQKILRSWYWISRAEAPSPTHFSALIVSVEPRRSPEIPTLK